MKFTLLPIAVCLFIGAHAAHADPIVDTQAAQKEQLNMVVDLYKSYIVKYGQRPPKGWDDLEDIAAANLKDQPGAFIRLMDAFSSHRYKEGISIDYVFRKFTIDGELFDAPIPTSARIAYLYTPQFVENDLGYAPSGSYSVMWDNFSTSLVPYDMVYLAWLGDFVNGQNKMKTCFAGEYALLPYGMSYEEQFTRHNQPFAPTYKRTFKEGVQNGGPESLVQLSRRENFPNIYGLEREKLYQVFDPKRSNWTLEELRAGATKLGFETQIKDISLDELQKSGAPALLQFKGEEVGDLVVTLLALDEDRAVVVVRGLTKNVSRDLLEKHYSGQALLPVKAIGQMASIVADDPARELRLDALDNPQPQRFVLRNTGNKPVSLRLEYPLLGIAQDPKLSKSVLGPGESATLDLQVKWRSVLDAPTQNVYVTLATSDPVVPRLQLAVLLMPPQDDN